ncbi:hypothetical protein PtB15_9B99 [Puccinia triticina]|nr:hypothetical protein PtB15_9B99 [Puccinia triticina]
MLTRRRSRLAQTEQLKNSVINDNPGSPDSSILTDLDTDGNDGDQKNDESSLPKPVWPEASNKSKPIENKTLPPPHADFTALPDESEVTVLSAKEFLDNLKIKRQKLESVLKDPGLPRKARFHLQQSIKVLDESSATVEDGKSLPASEGVKIGTPNLLGKRNISRSTKQPSQKKRHKFTSDEDSKKNEESVNPNQTENDAAPQKTTLNDSAPVPTSSSVEKLEKTSQLGTSDSNNRFEKDTSDLNPEKNSVNLQNATPDRSSALISGLNSALENPEDPSQDPPISAGNDDQINPGPEKSHDQTKQSNQEPPKDDSKPAAGNDDQINPGPEKSHDQTKQSNQEPPKDDSEPASGPTAEQNIGGAIPKSDHFIRERVDGYSEGTCEAKISELELASFID